MTFSLARIRGQTKRRSRQVAAYLERCGMDHDTAAAFFKWRRQAIRAGKRILGLDESLRRLKIRNGRIGLRRRQRAARKITRHRSQKKVALT